MDDISTTSHNFTMEENICERHFLDNVSQNSQERYTVKLPIKEQILNIGDSRESALKRLTGIERRFKRDPTLKSQYAAFLDEYVSLGNMRRVEPLRKKQYRFIFHTTASSKRLSKHRKFVLYLMHLAAAVPAYH